MLRISNIGLGITQSEQQLKQLIEQKLNTPLLSFRIVKRSVDARKKEQILFIYTIDVEVNGSEQSIVHKAKSPDVSIAKEKKYQFPQSGEETMQHRPVIIHII